ncbi:beta strand repeat-containing protein [Paraburkholderia acidiphila]|uniref:beta strand repeat-containing protein n=1 Tax=Paraburkholderia acidiphila TaxID=2571747 RepID=UPI001E492F84|nr:YadA-like family protein [Paraburkholderia acidiphila]
MQATAANSFNLKLALVPLGLLLGGLAMPGLASAAGFCYTNTTGTNYIDNRVTGVQSGCGGPGWIDGTVQGSQNAAQMYAGGTQIDLNANLATITMSPDGISKFVMTAVGNNVLLTGVAAGAVNATSVQGINGSQLYGLANSTATALGGGSTVTSNGTVSAPSYALSNANSIAGTTGAATDIGTAFSKVDAALGQINSIGIKYFHTNSVGADSTASATNSTAIGPAALATNTNAIAIGNGATAATANSVALGNGATTSAANATSGGTIGGTSYTYAGATPTGVVSVGATGATRQITNVAAGQVTASSTDAVNGSELFATNTQVTANATNITNLQGQVTTLQGNVTTLQGNVTTLQGNVTTLQGNITTINGQITNIQGQLADAVMYDSSAHSSVTLGGTGASSTVKLTNVTNGTLSTSSTDAVNGQQLYATNTNVSNLAGNVTNLAGNVTTIQGNVSTLSGDVTTINGQITNMQGQLADAVMYDSSAHSSVTLGGTGASSTVKLTNVTNGTLSTSSTDAVNGQQLYATNTNVSNLAGNVTNLAGNVTTNVTNLAGNVTSIQGNVSTLSGDVTTINGQITNMQGQLADAVMYDSSAHSSVTLGGTGATAPVTLTNVANGALNASSLDAVNARAEGNFQMAAAAGTYGGETALAVGANWYVSDRLLLNAHVSKSTGGGSVGASVGATFGF